MMPVKCCCTKPVVPTFVFFILALGLPLPAGAQESVSGSPGIATQRAVIDFSDLAWQEALAAARAPKVIHSPLPGPWGRTLPGQLAGPADAQASATIPSVVAPPLAPFSPAPTSSFSALGDNNSAIPPDTHGAVGPAHLMVTLNTQVRIQDRTGTTLSTVSLDAFWASLSMPPPVVFDPKVLYDPVAGRWMFTAMADAQSTTSSVLIGVSQTSDPTGMWNLYRIDADAGNTLWADYPSMGFNKDWIVVQVNMFTIAGNLFARSHIYVFDKADLYAAGTGQFTLLQDTSGFTQVPAITHDNALSTMYLLETWTTSQLRLSTITGAVGSETLTPGVAFPSSPDAWAFGLPDNSAPQMGSATGIMTNDGRIQNVVYRNGSLWTTHMVFLPAAAPTRSAVQWWQITPTGSVLQRGRVDDAGASTFYAFPSVAVNKFDDVLIGYSRFAAAQFASANYSFRNAADALNTLQADFLLKIGEDTYIKDFGTGRVRWGDYSNTVVDPTNDTDMWTIQEYAVDDVGPLESDDRWGTWWGQVVVAPTTADLGVMISDAPDPATVGNNLAYTITVTNNGPNPANSVLVTDTLPAGVTFVSAVPMQGTCNESSGTVMCNLLTINNSANATVTLTVTPTATNPALSNTASVTGNVIDGVAGNDSATAMTTVDNPVPTLTTLNPNTAFVGGPAFTLTVNGTNFLNLASTVQWNGTARTTTFVSSTQLQAAITAADIAAVGMASVTVVNDPPGGGISNALTFSIVNPPPPPLPPPTGGGSSSDCFIATAAYGTPMAEEIRYLRAFRDGYLLPNRIGRRFVELYYRYSPPIADYISQRQQLRRVVRVALMPLVTLSKWLVGDRIADNSHHTLR